MQLRYLVPAALVLALAAWLLTVKMSYFIFYGVPIIAGVFGAILFARSAPDRTYVGHLATAVRLYFALHLIWTSLRYWSFPDIQPVVPDPIGGPFIVSLEAMGIFPAIKALEGLVGVALLFNRFVPLALLLEMPASVNIFWLNVLVVADSHTIASGTAELAVNASLLLAYLPLFRPLLAPINEPFPSDWPDRAPVH